MDRARQQDVNVGDDAQRHSAVPANAVWRIRGVPMSFDEVALEGFLQNHPDLKIPDSVNGRSSVEVRTLAADLRRDQVATVHFSNVPPPLALLEPNGQLFIKPPENTDKSTERRLARRTMSIDRNFHHVTVLFTPPADGHDIDILVVCGLGGHAFGSFVHKANGHMWLCDSLPQDMPTARVMIYGYDSKLQGSSSFATLEDFAIVIHNTVCQLLRSTKKHLVLIGHSLGGLLIKEALAKLADSGSDSELLNLVVGALFFGVPNDGMNIESLVPLVKDQPNQFLLHTLNYINSTASSHQNRIFNKVMERQRFDLYCFYETELSPTASIDVSGVHRMNGVPSCLVTRTSATSCLPIGASSDYYMPINRTHSDMVKFSPYDAAYDTVLDKLNQIRHKLRAKPWKLSTDSTGDKTSAEKQKEYMEKQDIKQAETEPVRENEDILRRLDEAARSFQSQRRFKEEEGILRQTLIIRRGLLGEENAHTLENIRRLGDALDDQGQYRAAEELYRKAVEGQKKVLGEENPQTLRTMSDLGRVLAVQFQFEAAEEMCQKAFIGQKRVLGEEHEDTLNTMNNLGVALLNQDLYKEAETVYQELTTIQRRLLGEEHEDTLNAMTNLGVALLNQDLYKEAETVYQELTTIQRRLLGEEHEDTLEAMANLGAALLNQDLYEEAERVYQELTTIHRRVPVEVHPDILEGINFLGMELRNRAKKDSAGVTPGSS